MGADLIGFMVEGPRVLPDPKSKEARSLVGACVDRILECETLDDLFREYDDGTGRFDSPDELGPIFGWDGDKAPTRRWLTREAKRLYSELFSVWTNGARDAAVRSFEDGRLTMFAGELSWGDEPQGFAYETLRDASLWRITEAVGIE